jgi:hypothetical protein
MTPMNDTTHTILIVEDEPEVLELLDVIIAAEGYAMGRLETASKRCSGWKNRTSMRLSQMY